MGRTEGITEDDLRALSDYENSDRFSQREKAVLELAAAMTKTPPVISDELFARLQEHFSTEQLVEITYAIGMENFRGRFNRVFRCEPAGFSDGAFCPMPETTGQIMNDG